MRRLFRAVLAIAIVLVLGETAASARASGGSPAIAAGHGISVRSEHFDGERTLRMVLGTTALAKPVRVNVLLPAGYTKSDRRYPVLYLFHGTGGGADDWLKSGDAAALTERYPMIVVMPDAGYDGNGGGWFTDWVHQDTTLGKADWETFHIGQLVPWIDQNLRTSASRSGRAVAGLSQGGFGAFSYAARHPDLFSSAASFSGAPDIARNPLAKTAAVAVISATASVLDGVRPDAMFGDPIIDGMNWSGHNPASLATNLGHTSLHLWAGDGIPGPLDSPSVDVILDGLLEGVVHESSVFFANDARRAHTPYHFDDYGPGTHSWPYWSRDLTQYLPRLARTFDHPAPAPAAVSYRSVDPRWSQWGWTVTAHRTVRLAWSGLSDASLTGFEYTGAPATVTTPAVYRPGARYRVGGAVHGAVTADRAGRLTITLPSREITPARVTIATR